MKIPFKPSLLKIRRESVKYIIIHHTIELYKDPDSKIDNPKYQLPGLFKGVLEKKQADVNYHYVIEKIKEDFIPIICRPLPYLCEFEDINPNINNRSIHISFLGTFDFKIPEKREYEVLAFRLLNPMLKMFRLSPSKIKLHNEVSNNKDLTCPGIFFNKEIMIAMTRKFLVK